MSDTTTAPAPAAPAPAPSAPAPAPAAPAPAPSAPAPAPAPASALASGATPAPPGAPAPAPSQDPNAWIPEKHRVQKEDGTLDLEASARKVAEGYGHLEKRLGSGDAPPANVDGYKVNVPEAFKDAVKSEDLAKTPGVQALLKDLHASGASQKTVDAAISSLMREGAAMREAMPQMQASECEATLRQVEGWKDDQQYVGQMRMAFGAGKQIFGEAFQAMEKKGYWNDPDFIKGLASIGREMQEDRGPSPEAMQQLNTSLDTLMADPSYTNASHPQHAATVAKVTALQAQVSGTRPVVGGKSMSFKSA